MQMPTFPRFLFYSNKFYILCQNVSRGTMKPSLDEKQKALLNQFLAANNVTLSKETLDKLYGYADLVVETKEFGNLISPKDSEKFLSRHIADSLIPFIYINGMLDSSRTLCAQNDTRESSSPEGNSKFKIQNSELNSPDSNCELCIDNFKLTWADMGSGAGCPVFPLAIAMPNVKFYAVEPRNMRVKFMQMAKEKLHLDNLTVVGKRFETAGLANLDFISCRALSTFENDWERAKVGLKKGGIFATLKSYHNVEELEGNPAIHIQKYNLPEEEQLYAFVTRGNE